jgi:hypothetical protein
MNKPNPWERQIDELHDYILPEDKERLGVRIRRGVRYELNRQDKIDFIQKQQYFKADLITFLYCALVVQVLALIAFGIMWALGRGV